MSQAKRQMIMFALGYFLAGAYLVSFIYTFLKGSNIDVTFFGNIIALLAIAYVVVAFIFNVNDRRRNK